MGDAQEFHQLVHGELTLGQQLDDLDPRLIRQPIEHLRDIDHLLFIHAVHIGKPGQCLAADLPGGEVLGLAWMIWISFGFDALRLAADLVIGCTGAAPQHRLGQAQ